ncbi:MAG: hypothetical protein AAGJ18_13755 [Bacteroidota bacterium]
MMDYKYSFLFFAFCLFIIACQPDNFDEIIEEPLPYEPVVLEEGNQISFRFKGRNTNYPQGYGVVVESSSSKRYYLSSDTVLVCETSIVDTDSSSIESSNVIVRFNDFFINFTEDINGEIRTASGTIIQTSDQNERTTFIGGWPFVPKCSSDYPTVLTIEEKTSEMIKGTFEAEFFQSVVDSLIPPAPDNCADWESVGIMRAAFAIPLTVCE